ncbi:restriction endonuclease subunit S [Acetobacter pasteurianus]|uniref:Type I site-specific deoxyribonuclease n=1 Tax=Acetobacter pasteurianus subsp. pasteurianus TaxID=481145 RepID=A0A1Y0YAM9_ACEPA|nr:restriction endonuclease subunit S [Acetobacter pasteurianus]ARW49444.1 Type I site-specific deoxyribonuclease [Acetobacter pasteurianus subsp. pasteurianus]
MTDWHDDILENCLETLLDYRGKSPPKASVGIPVLSAKVVKTSGLLQPIEQKIAFDYYAKWMVRGLPHVGDVVMTTEGPMGEVIQLTEETVQYALGQRIVCLRGKSGILDNTFLRYLLSSPSQQNILEGYSTGTTVPGISQKALRSLPISYPPFDTQRQIGILLSSLDDKIDLNRRTNETLEAMARTLFRDWFVDFGPTRAKMAGEAPYLAPELWELFPDGLDEEGKPEGWNFSSIYDVASVVYGAPFASSLFNTQSEGIPLVRIRDLPSEKPSVWTTEVHPKGFKILPGMIVVGMDGEFRAHLWGGEEAWLNQRVCVFQPKDGISSVFLRETIIPQLKFIEDTEVATTVIHLGKGDIDAFKTLLPSHEIMASFSDLAQIYYDKIVLNKQEGRSLAQLRDLLLPKLMSGEISIRDAEKMVEDAA